MNPLVIVSFRNEIMFWVCYPLAGCLKYLGYFMEGFPKGRVQKKNKKQFGKFHNGSGPPSPPPRLWKKKLFFFLKLDHFWELFVKSVFLPLKIQKNLENFSKNDKTNFRQANFCLLRCQILPRYAQWWPQHTKFWPQQMQF